MTERPPGTTGIETLERRGGGDREKEDQTGEGKWVVCVCHWCVCVCGCSLLRNSILCFLPPYFLHLQNVSACQTRLPRLFVAFIAQAVLSNQVSWESQREKEEKRGSGLQRTCEGSARTESHINKKPLGTAKKTSVLMSHIFYLFVEKQSWQPSKSGGVFRFNNTHFLSSPLFFFPHSLNAFVHVCCFL